MMFPKRSQTRWIMVISIVAIAANFFAVSGGAVEITSAEMQQKDTWFQEHFLNAKPLLPFSFVYDGKKSDTFLPSWPQKTETGKLDNTRTRHTYIWADPQTGLEVRCVAVNYADFPAVEWTVYFTNIGKENTPVLESIQGLDCRFERGTQGEFILHHWKGDTFNEDLYQPLELILNPGVQQGFAPVGGRGSNGSFPYYKLAIPGGGVMIAVGWPGQWASSFTRDSGVSLQVTAGQELTHMILKPGETVRAPLIAFLFWKGDDITRAQNLWRRWMWEHNVPRTADGKLPAPSIFGNTSLEFNEMCNANEENQKYFLDRYQEEKVQLDFWWMDAGWYPCDGNWPKTGTWEPDLTRFPKGLRAISDHALTQGVKTLVWFEPERVAGDTWISTNHPEWLLGGTLLNLGMPEVRTWLTDHVDRVLREQGIHFYRQDFNMDPLDFWRKNDSPDRQGMTENFHIQNYLAYWDALRERHPDLLVDSCASGGRRNDLETMRRAVALHPTDYNYSNLTVKQAFHFSLFQWIPYYASNVLPIETVNTYAFRSGHALGSVLSYDLRNQDLDYENLRNLTNEWRRVSPMYYGDYYPLTPYNISAEHWIAWQFHRTAEEDGVVEAFRREKNQEASNVFLLHGLDPASRYEIVNLDESAPKIMTGRELMEQGLQIELSTQPAAGTVLYKRVK